MLKIGINISGIEDEKLEMVGKYFMGMTSDVYLNLGWKVVNKNWDITAISLLICEKTTDF